MNIIRLKSFCELITAKKALLILIAITAGLLPAAVFADAGLTAITVQDTAAGKTYSVTLQIVALMTVLTLLPALLLTMTSFTRIIIVLSILRQALGTAQTPSNQVLIGLSLFLTFFIMSPVFTKVYNEAYLPYSSEKISADDAIEKVKEPFRAFMLAQTREDDIALFARISDHGAIDSADNVPFSLLMPAFLTSELKTAFQIGFMLFIPFLIIDLVVASVLMAMGMMMLSPLIISLPFKLMLFVLIDGWALVTGTLAMSFVT